VDPYAAAPVSGFLDPIVSHAVIKHMANIPGLAKEHARLFKALVEPIRVAERNASTCL
jgi:hypothetical protein